MSIKDANGDIYNWTINGENIITVPEQYVSLKVTTDSPDFPTGGVEDFFGYHMTINFSIDHDGEFGFTAMSEYKVGKEYAGDYANLFYVVGDGNFEFVESSLVDEEGYASFYFTYASFSPILLLVVAGICIAVVCVIFELKKSRK